MNKIKRCPNCGKNIYPNHNGEYGHKFNQKTTCKYIWSGKEQAKLIKYE